MSSPKKIITRDYHETLEEVWFPIFFPDLRDITGFSFAARETVFRPLSDYCNPHP